MRYFTFFFFFGTKFFVSDVQFILTPYLISGQIHLQCSMSTHGQWLPFQTAHLLGPQLNQSRVSEEERTQYSYADDCRVRALNQTQSVNACFKMVIFSLPRRLTLNVSLEFDLECTLGPKFQGVGLTYSVMVMNTLKEWLKTL